MARVGWLSSVGAAALKCPVLVWRGHGMHPVVVIGMGFGAGAGPGAVGPPLTVPVPLQPGHPGAAGRGVAAAAEAGGEPAPLPQLPRRKDPPTGHPGQEAAGGEWPLVPPGHSTNGVGGTAEPSFTPKRQREPKRDLGRGQQPGRGWTPGGPQGCRERGGVPRRCPPPCSTMVASRCHQPHCRPGWVLMVLCPPQGAEPPGTGQGGPPCCDKGQVGIAATGQDRAGPQ